jgi:hypothetical protein
MANVTDVIFWGSLGGLFVLAAQGFRKSRNIAKLFVWLVLLFMLGGWYFFAFEETSHLQSKGEQSSWLTILGLYGCMLAGMACNYLYAYFMNPESERKPFDFGIFIGPVFASPVVFIPLYLAFQNTNIGATSSQFAPLLVAFENGFFWKEVFDNRKRQRS